MNTFGKLEITAYIPDEEAGRSRRCKLFSLHDISERDSREFVALNRDFFTKRAMRYVIDPHDISVEFVFHPHPSFI